MAKKIILDTDPGIDDACAILLALASPEISIEGLSIVHGNCSLEQATKNALSVLELADASHIPVVKGCKVPLVQPSLLAPETHGGTGLGYAKLPEPRTRPMVQHGIDFLIEKIMAAPGEITLLAIGPLTNVALAIRQEPRLVTAVKELIIMGGAIRYEGNTTALGEFNTYVDPHAAHIVYHACPAGCDLSMYSHSGRYPENTPDRFADYKFRGRCDTILHGISRRISKHRRLCDQRSPCAGINFYDRAMYVPRATRGCGYFQRYLDGENDRRFL
jgi:inosine-uridine nucleoside N-ribohydrolase